MICSLLLLYFNQSVTLIFRTMASHDSTGQPSAKKPRLSGACSVSTNMDVGRGACGLLFFFLYIFLLISFFYILKIMSRNLVH